ncbi:type II toxin-antitoxin system HicA family toxin [uncultured Caulobacter sp.]|uniref:type II toxin-antitoxin system HicA family toxin n=1 Tax=uncultured Caulobacter sp. TaxID=158749 RepID=UPI00344D1528
MVSRPHKGRHAKTYDAIFAEPVRANIRWEDIEALFVALDADISEGAGSRVRVRLGEQMAVFHRPHPEKECSKGALKSVRRFLTDAGCNDDNADI